MAFLDVQIAEHESGHFQRANPSLAAGEAIFGTIALMTRPFAAVADRAAAAIARLTAVPAFLEGARRSITARVPDEWRVKCLRECDGAERLLRDGIQHWIALEGHRRLERGAPDARGRAGWCGVRELSRLARMRPVPVRLSRTLRMRPELFDLLLTRGHWCDRPRTTLAAEAAAGAGRSARTASHARPSDRAGGWPEVQQRLTSAHPAPDDYLRRLSTCMGCLP